ncbi:MAG: hypothetical protein LQ339_001512 [Xanthoria mediterranea]|nr:MAG: hypothetical protein LQ339_001512 [Xanthoria mediterranea]
MLECPYAGRMFCDDYMPLSTNIIIRCYGRRAVPANCNDNLAGISPVGVKDSAMCFDSLNGVVACYYNGFVYPDDGNPFRLPAAFAQYLHDTNASSTNSSAASTMSTVPLWPTSSGMLTVAGLNLHAGSGPAMATPRPTGGPLAPGSGGYYNLTTVTGSGLATLTGGFSIPRPSAPPFISGASKLAIGTVFLLVATAMICLVLCLVM